MGGRRRQVGRQDRCTRLVSRAMVSGSSRKAAAGEVLLVGVVLLQDGQPLQFGVGLGEREHGRVARGDRLHLGVGQFLAADVLGAAGRRCRRS